jgi:hypothetical protein
MYVCSIISLFIYLSDTYFGSYDKICRECRILLLKITLLIFQAKSVNSIEPSPCSLKDIIFVWTIVLSEDNVSSVYPIVTRGIFHSID